MQRLSLLLVLFFSHVFGNGDQEIAAKLGSELNQAAKQENFSGAVLLAKNGDVFFEKAYGLACRRFQVPNNLDTKFNLASIGKLFTSAAIAQLVEQNKLSLSDPISKYLTGWVSEEAAQKITIQDLLIHASGLGSFFDDKEFQLGDASGLYVKVEDYRPLVQKETLHFKPGTSQLYSNTGYLLLGAIIEKVSGRSYFDYIQTQIFVPAGMNSSGFFSMDDPVPNLAIGFGRETKKGQTTWKNNLFTNVFKGSPAGGGFSTVRDMHRFVQAIQERTILGEKMAGEFFSGAVCKPQGDIAYTTKKIDVQGQTFDGVFTQYGFAGVWNKFGLAIFSTNPLKIGHDGGGMRGINDDFILYPEHGYFAMIFSNYTGLGILDPRYSVQELLDARIAKP